LTENEWSHIAGVYNGSEMLIYINGELSGQMAFNGAVSISNLPLYIGADPTEGSGLYLPCKVDEVRIWDHARSSDQIKSLMYDTLSTEYYQSSDSGLVAYYRFDKIEDLGVNNDGVDDIRDLSLNANHGDTHGNLLLVDSDSPVGFIKDYKTIAQEFQLQQNYPNPFNPSTIISWHLAVGSHVDLSIYDLHGKKVATLVSEHQIAGTHQVEWDASGNTGIASGVYLYKLSTGNGYTASKKLLLLK
jgi:hypothetical protein